MTPEKRDKYYQSKYGITLAEYDAMLAFNDGRCWICLWRPGPEHNRLAVDHDHAIEKIKVIVFRDIQGQYHAYDEKKHFSTVNPASSRDIAVKAIKHQLKRLSVRGLVCWKCNSLLKKANDVFRTLHRAASYINRYHNEGTPVVRGPDEKNSQPYCCF